MDDEVDELHGLVSSSRDEGADFREVREVGREPALLHITLPVLCGHIRLGGLACTYPNTPARPHLSMPTRRTLSDHTEAVGHYVIGHIRPRSGLNFNLCDHLALEGAVGRQTHGPWWLMQPMSEEEALTGGR